MLKKKYPIPRLIRSLGKPQSSERMKPSRFQASIEQSVGAWYDIVFTNLRASRHAECT